MKNRIYTYNYDDYHKYKHLFHHHQKEKPKENKYKERTYDKQEITCCYKVHIRAWLADNFDTYF